MLFRPFVNISNHRTRLLVPKHLLVRMLSVRAYIYIYTYIYIYIKDTFSLSCVLSRLYVYHSMRRMMIETGLAKMHHSPQSLSCNLMQ